MKIENVEVYGFRSALRAMRNPKNSWNLSDSTFLLNDLECRCPWPKEIFVPERPMIGRNDLNLACRLIRGGSEHRKFLRQIIIWADLTLPRYLWTEFDTYKIGVVRNSCSTMHKLGSMDLSIEDFEDGADNEAFLLPIIETLNDLSRQNERTFLWLRRMKQFLPESYLQKSTVTFNYEVALSILRQRSTHRLKEWSDGICGMILSLPYMQEFYGASSR